jgi:hypothetical protein
MSRYKLWEKRISKFVLAVPSSNLMDM